MQEKKNIYSINLCNEFMQILSNIANIGKNLHKIYS
nr:MAG TPA: hypothetical protein [Caudoviricetes sp.]